MGACNSIDSDFKPILKNSDTKKSNNIVYSSFFSPEILKVAQEIVDNAEWKYGWRSNQALGYAHWNYNLVSESVYSGRANGIDISDHLAPSGKVIWNWFKKNISSNYNLTRFYANAHTYGIEGYPHTDSVRKDDKTIVIYLNREWKREWGGETVIYSDDDKEYDIELSQLPGYNRALMFDGYKWHCARSVTRICPVLRVTLILKVVPIDCDKMRYKIQKFLSTYGCFNQTHRQDSLAAHLLGVYDILKRKGLDDDTCAAGGLHSIFGTSQYLKSTLNSNNRNLLVNLIGEAATKYVELFSTLDRPKTIENALKELYASNSIQASTEVALQLIGGTQIKINYTSFQALVMIEYANIFQQKSGIEKFPCILNFWTNYSINKSEYSNKID